MVKDKKEYFKAYREANKDRMKERRRAYYEANKDRVREWRRAYYEARIKAWEALSDEEQLKLMNERAREILREEKKED